MSHTVFIAIGSNLGEKRENCKKAVELISNIKDTTLVAESHWYSNAAQLLPGSEPQPDFINGVVKIRTGLSPQELLATLQNIETKMGRRRSKKWAPRMIDLDIIFYDNLVLDEERLKIPHTELSKRTFVLEPMCDIEPSFVHPVLGRTVKELLAACS